MSRDGKLDKHEYVLAMHFIQCRQRGEALPAATPAGMLAAPPAALALSSVGGSNAATLLTIATSFGGGGGGVALASPLVHSLTHVGFPEASAYPRSSLHFAAHALRMLTYADVCWHIRRRMLTHRCRQCRASLLLACRRKCMRCRHTRCCRSPCRATAEEEEEEEERTL